MAGFVALFVIHFISPRGMGFGDVRLAGVIGMMLGLARPALHRRWGCSSPSCSLSVIGIVLIAARLRTRKDAVPFGPFMAMGAVLAVLWGHADPARHIGEGRAAEPYHGRRCCVFLTAGESHGRALLVIVEGLPAGLSITVEDMQAELARRRLGFGRGPRMRFEQDEVTLVSGVLHGRTIGSPVGHRDRQHRVAQVGGADVAARPAGRGAGSPSRGPGTPISPACRSTASTTSRNVLERASARETAARVAAGTCAKALLAALGIEVISHVVQLGAGRCPRASPRPRPADREPVDASAGALLRPGGGGRRWSPRSGRR